jgi:hypothetical protein
VIVSDTICTFEIEFGAILLPSIELSASFALVIDPSIIFSVVTALGASFSVVIAPSTMFCVFIDDARFKLNSTADHDTVNVSGAVGTTVAINISPSSTITTLSTFTSSVSNCCVMIYVAVPFDIVNVVGVASISEYPSTTV